jgi:signal-transduction protein with cAMP-binding, CBS, and nucleotidyltransferase domain
MSLATDTTRDRLATPVRELMKPGVVTLPDQASLLEAKRALVRHGVHAVLIAATDGRPLGWVTHDGLLPWLERDLASIQAAHAITEPPRFVELDATAAEALEALASSGATHLLVAQAPSQAPHGIVSPVDLVELLTAR